MMKNSRIALLACLLFLPTLAHAELARLTVIVSGILPATGKVEVSIFNSAETFMQTPLLQQSIDVEGLSETRFVFAGLIEGDYALVVGHDANANGVRDAGFLGFGGESYAFSNDASAWLGRPTFEDASISIGQEDMEILIGLD